ncbi:hypothetical protein ACOSQ3_029557 [Xanthoceras sorbifolium]
MIKLWESLSLNDEDGPVLNIRDEVHEEGVHEVSLCLVGKVLTRKKINREAFKVVMEQIWGLVSKVEIERIGVNTFVFHFSCLEDRARVWARGPWHFDQSLIVMEKPVVEIWAHIHNIPLLCMNCRIAILLAKSFRGGDRNSHGI